MPKPQRKPTAIESLQAEMQENVRMLKGSITQMENKFFAAEAAIYTTIRSVQEQFILTDEWRRRALKAEYDLAELRRVNGIGLPPVPSPKGPSVNLGDPRRQPSRLMKGMK